MNSPNATNPIYGAAADRLDTAADQQMAWNRAKTSNPWASQFSNPDGSIGQQFTGPMAGAQGNLMAQALRNMGSPTDFNQFNVGTGDDFRNQAIAGAQSQMGDWASQLQGGADDAARTRLLNAGYEEGSPQFQAQMGKGAGTAGDLQSSIGNAAIGLGTAGGAQRQGMDMLAKQQGLAEALRKRSLPMEQLSMMQKLGEQPGLDADDSITSGATMDLQTKLDNYWRQRGMAEEERARLDASLLGGFGAAASMVPTGMGLFGKGTPKAPTIGTGPKRSI